MRLCPPRGWPSPKVQLPLQGFVQTGDPSFWALFRAEPCFISYVHSTLQFTKLCCQLPYSPDRASPLALPLQNQDWE